MIEKSSNAAVRIVRVDQLRPGMFISLHMNWIDHPFMFSQFRISSEKQIETLKQLGINEIAYFPGKSTAEPIPVQLQAPKQVPVKTETTPEQMAQMAEKRKRVALMNEKKLKIAKCEKDYVQSAATFKSIMQNFFSKPDEAGQQAKYLVHGVVDSFMSESDVVIHLMNDKLHDESIYYHSLNVLILSLLLAKRLNLTMEQMRSLGLGALFHDIGKIKVPDAILRKKDTLNSHELKFYKLHVEYGVELAQETGILPKDAINVIRQHHEAMDGSGYPEGIMGNGISIPARLVAIANTYDNLCNPVRLEAALTPYEAMSCLYAKMRAQFDERVLKIFISSLGVYPPGSIVELDNGMIGMTISVNQDNILKPSVMIYDKDVPKNEAIIIDLAEIPDVSISRCIRPQQLAPEVYDYLNPRKSVRYFYQTEKK